MIILDRLTALLIAAITLMTGAFVSDAVESQPEAIQAVVETTTSTPFAGNPFLIEELTADTHDSEESIPAVPKLPEGIGYSPRAADREIISTTSTSTTTTIPLPEGPCSEYYGIALDAGWEIDQLNKLGRIMKAESACIHDIANKTYSYGLTQIEWSAHKDWLDSEFGITEREDLYDPYTNLLVAKWLFDYAENTYGCGWQPWYMSGNWC